MYLNNRYKKHLLIFKPKDVLSYQELLTEAIFT